jgi:hypothetical protein
MKRGLPSKYLWSDTDDEWKGALERDSTPKLISSTERRSRQSARAAKPTGLKPKAVNKLSCAQSPTNRVLELQGRTGKSLQSWFARAREGSDLNYIECSINRSRPHQSLGYRAPEDIERERRVLNLSVQRTRGSPG